MVDGGWHPTALCRVYIAIQYGLLEPALLLLALFACVYSLQVCNEMEGGGGDSRAGERELPYGGSTAGNKKSCCAVVVAMGSALLMV